jgi:hypothetical protein
MGISFFMGEFIEKINKGPIGRYSKLWGKETLPMIHGFSCYFINERRKEWKKPSCSPAMASMKQE